MRKMRSNRSSPVAPVAAESDAAMTMAQMAEMMRSLQATVEASRVEQARIHEDNQLNMVKRYLEDTHY